MGDLMAFSAQVMCACGDIYLASAFVCDNCRASESAVQLEPVALDEHDEFMASAAYMTCAYELPRDPKPSRDWQLFRDGWSSAAAVYAATPAVQPFKPEDVLAFVAGCIAASPKRFKYGELLAMWESESPAIYADLKSTQPPASLDA